MIQIPQPDHQITIGFKDGKVISVDWGTQWIGDTTEQIFTNVKDKLRLAIKFMESKEQSK